ncbi:MAG: YeeE/YedE thiosulfate transporter family protein [Methanomicrobiales archaeon]
MFDALRANRPVQLLLGLLMGMVFGFLLQRGGVTYYDVILGQLLLTDFTVVKVMLSAVVVGMIGIYAMNSLGWVNIHARSGAIGSVMVGGLIFGLGFAVLGYCPGTVAGALGQGSLDALFGIAGLVLGAGVFAILYPRLEGKILEWGPLPAVTLWEWAGVRPWTMVIPAAVLILLILAGLEFVGL